MFKKAITILLVVLLVVGTLTACGGKDTPAPPSATTPAGSTATPDATPAATPTPETDVPEEVAEETPEEPVETAAPLTEAGEEGDGPVTLYGTFSDITIPAEMSYEVKYVPSESEFGGNVKWLGTLLVDIGFGGSVHHGDVEITTTRMVSSLDTAVAECFRTCTFSGAREGEELGEITFGDTTYRIVTIYAGEDHETCNLDTYLIGYYKNSADEDIYIEVRVSERDSFGSNFEMKLDDPRFVALMNSIVYHP